MPGRGAHAPGEAWAIEPGHVQVQEDEAGQRLSLELGEPREAVGRDRHAAAHGLDALSQCGAYVSVVVDDEDTATAAHGA
jgi:hypothetical protein